MKIGLIEVKIDDEVWVQLSADGIQTLREYHKIPDDQPLPDRLKPNKEGDWYKFSISELMYIFGPKMGLTGPDQFRRYILRFVPPE